MIPSTKEAGGKSTLYIPEAPETDSAAQTMPLLISYPKSGRTWLRYIFALVQKPVEFSHAGSGSNIKIIGKKFSAIESEAAENRRCLFMHRNPIDTAISYFFHVTKKDFQLHHRFLHLPRLYFEDRLPPRDMPAFLRHPGFGVEKICKFNRAWIDHLSEQKDALIFSYEDMKFRSRQTLAGVFDFTKFEPVDLDWVLEQSSFENMRAAEKSGKAKHLKLRQSKSSDPDSAKVRRGKVMGYSEYLDAANIEHFRDLCRGYGFEA